MLESAQQIVATENSYAVSVSPRELANAASSVLIYLPPILPVLTRLTFFGVSSVSISKTDLNTLFLPQNCTQTQSSAAHRLLVVSTLAQAFTSKSEWLFANHGKLFCKRTIPAFLSGAVLSILATSHTTNLTKCPHPYIYHHIITFTQRT